MKEDALIKLSKNTDALFLDFDGTLAPLQDNPDTVALPTGVAETLSLLSQEMNGALAVISGRGLSDLAKRVPQCLWRLGNHGLYSAAPFERAIEPPQTEEKLHETIQNAITQFEGVRIEQKGPVFAVHYRQAPLHAEALGHALEKTLRDFPHYNLQHGKCIYEAKPEGANKGLALTATLNIPPFAGRRPIMVGDDLTDEDAFQATQDAGGVAIKVGLGPTIANYRLSDVAAVHTMLKEFL